MVSLPASEDGFWGPVKLSGLLVQALLRLNFHTPTPIQAAAIPLTLNAKGKCDVVGAAETGSGKTLAFCLPVLDTLIRDWPTRAMQRVPFALIISPTRELTMQITSVLKEVCTKLREVTNGALRIEIVSVVGGMSEHKQRRQLSGQGKPAHIIVATPGRLCEMIQDEEIVAFQDLSRMRFLVVDEADRIVEEGHFPELQRVFSRIRDHEEIACRGEVPSQVYAKRREGTTFDEGDDEVDAREHKRQKKKTKDKKQPVKLAFDKMPTQEEMERYRKMAQELGKTTLTTTDLGIDDDEDGEDGENDDGDEIHFDPMPTEEEIAEARRNTPAVPYDEEEDEEHVQTHEGAGAEELEEDDTPRLPPSLPLLRQTLLYSATALKVQLQTDRASQKKEKKIKGLTGENIRNLPHHMQQLLSTVSTEKQRNVKVVDVTGVGLASTAATTSAATTASNTNTNSSSSKVSLPKGLSQLQVMVPAEDKDVAAYSYLLNQSGRTLLFVNSIKTARRVDGLLRALGLNCRTIHAQLQQKQRLKALESFQASPIGVLVATDVAARGLDIPKINVVMHYDVARSPQVYVHRSGRTARANTEGTSISLVAPEDLVHHEAICRMLGVTALKSFVIDIAEMGVLRERVKLAKNIFTQSFVASQKDKEASWLNQTASEAGLDLDDYMIEEEGTKEKQQQQSKKSKKKIERARTELKAMLDKPVALSRQGLGARSKGFVVFAK